MTLTNLKTPKQVAELLQRCEESVLRLIEQGEMRAVNVGAGKTKPRWLISESDIEDFVRRRQNAPPPKVRQPRKQAAAASYYPE